MLPDKANSRKSIEPGFCFDRRIFPAYNGGNMAYPGISIFFPAFNEEKNIENTVKAAVLAATPLFSDFEIIIIDDGSKDKTPEIIDSLAKSDKNIKAVHHPENKGYGAAVRSGFVNATKELVFFTDGDSQFDISEIKLLLPLINEADLVIGYRIKRRDPLHRRLFAKLWGAFIAVLFNIWVSDMDCAFKLIKRKVIQNLDLKSNGAFISAELLIKAKKKGFKIKQVGVHHYPRKEGKQTGANIKVILKAFYELSKLWRDLR
ncbi:MAG: glycosyltransferase family 2 protein [bacterium]